MSSGDPVAQRNQVHPRHAPSRVGQRLGRYELVALIGEGGMSQVYQAWDLETDRTVALKVLGDEHARNASTRGRFEREWKLLGDLVHPNVVQVLEGTTVDARPPLFAMELLVGESLHDRLDRVERLAAPEAIELFIQAADGFDAAHQLGIVHRDVKPGNVFLCDDPPGRVKVVDFGLARFHQSQVTGAGMLVGTPQYVAPEQATGDPVDARADVYGLGLVMYRALTGHHPFSADDDVTTLGHQLFTRPPPFAWFVDDVPAPLEALVRRMLRKVPAKRPASMAEVGRILRAIRAGESLSQSISDVEGGEGEDRYGPLNALASSFIKNALIRRGFRVGTEDT